MEVFNHLKVCNFTEFPDMEILWKGSFRIVSGDLPEVLVYCVIFLTV